MSFIQYLFSSMSESYHSSKRNESLFVLGCSIFSYHSFDFSFFFCLIFIINAWKKIYRKRWRDLFGSWNNVTLSITKALSSLWLFFYNFRWYNRDSFKHKYFNLDFIVTRVFNGALIVIFFFFSMMHDFEHI